MISSMKLLCCFNMVNYCFYKDCLFNFRCMRIVFFSSAFSFLILDLLKCLLTIFPLYGMQSKQIMTIPVQQE